MLKSNSSRQQLTPRYQRSALSSYSVKQQGYYDDTRYLYSAHCILRSSLLIETIFLVLNVCNTFMSIKKMPMHEVVMHPTKLTQIFKIVSWDFRHDRCSKLQMLCQYRGIDKIQKGKLFPAGLKFYPRKESLWNYIRGPTIWGTVWTPLISIESYIQNLLHQSSNRKYTLKILPPKDPKEPLFFTHSPPQEWCIRLCKLGTHTIEQRCTSQPQTICRQKQESMVACSLHSASFPYPARKFNCGFGCENYKENVSSIAIELDFKAT